MRQIIGHRDSTKITKYKVVIGETTMDATQPNAPQRRIFIKPKRFRSAFTTEQINYLENQYRKFPYINKDQRKEVATVLQIGERSVKIWFQNRRMREKKENHKEFDDETSINKEIGKYQLNNVPAPPSTNYQRLYSLPILPSTADTVVKVNTNDVKANKDNNKEKLPTQTENNRKPDCKTTALKQPNLYEDASNQEHLSPYFYHAQNATLPFTTEMKNKRSSSQECNTSAEFSINLCKKYKQECHKIANVDTKIAACGNIGYEGRVKKKVERQTLKKDINYYNSSQGFPTAQKSKLSHPQEPNQVNLNNPTYYPVMPSFYAPPLISSGGVLWKPVNYMPVMATNTPPVAPSSPHGSTTHEQSKNCKCNCHGTTHNVPITLPPNLQNPYAQYVITVPFSHTSPKY